MSLYTRLARPFFAALCIGLGTCAVAHAQTNVDAFNPGTNGAVRGIAVQPDGKIVVVGIFDRLGGGGSGTTMREKIGRLNPDGTLDTAFNPGAGSWRCYLPWRFSQTARFWSAESSPGWEVGRSTNRVRPYVTTSADSMPTARLTSASTRVRHWVSTRSQCNRMERSW